MKDLNTKIIRENIFLLVDCSGISDVSFANVLGISTKNLKRIKKTTADFNIKNINKSSDFFQKTIDELNTKNLLIKLNLREELIFAHKGNSEYTTLLEKRPPITYALNYILFHNEKFKTTGLSTQQINTLFQEHNLKYSSSYISSAMSRNKDKIQIRPSLENDKIFIYKLR